MSNFHKFAKQVHARLLHLSKNELFVTVSDKDKLWDTYLNSFPPKSNPIFRERTEHDCSCCRNFVKNFGGIVAVIDGTLQSIWAISDAEHPYAEVAQALDALVTSSPITGLFRASEPSYGAEFTHEHLEDGTVRKWNHFHGKVDKKHFIYKNARQSVDQVRGDYATTVGVFRRGLTELTSTAIADVVDLIAQKALYRGEEFMRSITEFKQVQQKFNKLKTDQERDVFVWTNANSPAARFRNTVIGTLIQDLSNGVELETAVRSFEQKVAPTNYKRPTALITPRMAEDAMKKIRELDLESALARRHAVISDVSVNNVLWVDNSVKGKMRDGIEDILMSAATAATKTEPKDAVPITIDEFFSTVVPNAQSMELYVSNQLQNNFVSITAPVYSDVNQLFKWDNNFAWSYDGDITDSIKEKVKRAGGNVTAPFRVSLAWFNKDDLDIHAYCPGHEHIYFGDKKGVLDVDMNVTSPVNDPVENLSWSRPKDGVYEIKVNQYSKRTSENPGCVIEVENNNRVTQYSYNKAISGNVVFGKITLKNGEIVNLEINKGFVSGSASVEKWNVNTETFHKVNTVMLSPNYWDQNSTGNKHWFFILDKCKNPEPCRGIYNEFLSSGLEKHRKVFEVLGNKTKCEVSDEQLSGLGFSSTRKDAVKIRVQTKNQTRIYEVAF